MVTRRWASVDLSPTPWRHPAGHLSWRQHASNVFINYKQCNDNKGRRAAQRVALRRIHERRRRSIISTSIYAFTCLLAHCFSLQIIISEALHLPTYYLYKGIKWLCCSTAQWTTLSPLFILETIQQTGHSQNAGYPVIPCIDHKNTKLFMIKLVEICKVVWRRTGRGFEPWPLHHYETTVSTLFIHFPSASEIKSTRRYKNKTCED